MRKKKATEMYLNILLESLSRTTRGLSKENRLSGSEFRWLPREELYPSGQHDDTDSQLKSVSKWRDIVCSFVQHNSGDGEDFCSLALGTNTS